MTESEPMGDLHPDVVVNLRRLIAQLQTADEPSLSAVREALLVARASLLTRAAGRHDDPAVSMLTTLFNVAAQQRHDVVRCEGRQLVDELEQFLAPPGPASDDAVARDR